MSPILFHFSDSGQRIPCSFYKLFSCNVPKIIGGKVGQERKPDVSRRGAMRYSFNGVFLVIIRGQPIILASYKRFKKYPCLSRQFMKENILLFRKLCFWFRKGTAN